LNLRGSGARRVALFQKNGASEKRDTIITLPSHFQHKKAEVIKPLISGDFS
jgi:hypothetical protein